MNKPIVVESAAEPSDQERLMALLALTVQELPQAPSADARSAAAQAAEDASFRRLDSDPVALEAYLRRGMREPHSVRVRWRSWVESLGIWLSPPQLRFAAAMAVVVAVTALVVIGQRGAEPLAALEENFARVELTPPPNGLQLPWEIDAAVQGFTPMAGNDTPAGRAFALGLLRGRARVTGERASVEAVPEGMTGYVALGEWNVLLWSVSAEANTRDDDFWQSQLSVARTLEAALPTENEAVLASHMATMEQLLAALVRSSDRRAMRDLNAELSRFRTAYAPLRADVLAPTP